MNRWGKSGWVILGLLLVTSAGRSGPVGGSIRETIKIDGGPGEFVEKVTFEGNQRACAILRGDHNPSATVGIEVYDENNRLVVKHSGKDFATVIWYPPVRATYTIRFLNQQAEYNICDKIIK